MSRKLIAAMLAKVEEAKTAGSYVGHNNHPPWKNGK